MYCWLLLQRLHRSFGLTGSVLQWMTSFLTGRTQQVVFDGSLSSTRPVFYGVPQGSVLGPLLFTLYTADISKVVASHGLQLHQYADDCQVYLFFLHLTLFHRLLLGSLPASSPVHHSPFRPGPASLRVDAYLTTSV